MWGAQETGKDLSQERDSIDNRARAYHETNARPGEPPFFSKRKVEDPRGQTAGGADRELQSAVGEEDDEGGRFRYPGVSHRRSGGGEATPTRSGTRRSAQSGSVGWGVAGDGAGLVGWGCGSGSVGEKVHRTTEGTKTCHRVTKSSPATLIYKTVYYSSLGDFRSGFVRRIG